MRCSGRTTSAVQPLSGSYFAKPVHDLFERGSFNESQKSSMLRGSRFRPPRHIAPPGEETLDRDIFVEVFPVQAEMADLDLLAIGRARFEEAGEPGERDPESAPIHELDPHRRVVKPDCRCRNGHATLARMPTCSPGRSLKYASA